MIKQTDKLEFEGSIYDKEIYTAAFHAGYI